MNVCPKYCKQLIYYYALKCTQIILNIFNSYSFLSRKETWLNNTSNSYCIRNPFKNKEKNCLFKFEALIRKVLESVDNK